MAFVIMNGELVERNRAKVDIEDRGFQFGDGIYEVLAIYDGNPFALSDHYRRLRESAGQILMDLPFSEEDLKTHLFRLMEMEKRKDGHLYLQVTRGVFRRQHAIPEKTSPTWFLYFLETPDVRRAREEGVKTVTLEDIRWHRCDIKSLNLLGNVLLKQEAIRRGAYEAILHRGGRVTEGSSANVWIVKNGCCITRPADPWILNGITRQRLLALGKEKGIPMAECPFTVEELRDADEAFLTSTVMEVVPVIEVDGRKIGNGRPGPITRELGKLFSRSIERERMDGSGD